jgi:site-specific recombinase XerD
LPVRQTFVPHIYTRAELRALLSATAQVQKRNSLIDAQTLRAFLILLYGTGSMLGEMIALRTCLTTARGTAEAICAAGLSG